MVAPAAKGVLFVIKLRPPYSPSELYSVTPAGSPVTKMLKDGTVSEPLLVTLSVCVQSPVSKSSPVSEPAGKLEGLGRMLLGLASRVRLQILLHL